MRPPEKRASDRAGAKGLAPALFRAEQMRQHPVVVVDLRMLGVKPDLERQDLCAVDRVRGDHLGLVVFAGRLLGIKPHLDPVGPRPALQGAEVVGDHAPDGLGDLLKQR